MKRTILSSLLFLYPINTAFQNRDRFMLNMNSIALAASVINHSHTFHNDHFRRALFGYIDEKFMMLFTGTVAYNCLKKTPTFNCFLHVFGVVGTLIIIYFYVLKGYRRQERAMENYNEFQKYMHMVMHFVGIVGLTRLYQKFVYAQK